MMLEGVIRMADMTAGDVMVPRRAWTCSTSTRRTTSCCTSSSSTGHSRFPVYEGQRDNVIGILMAKDLLKLQRAPELNLRTLLRPAVFVPESKALNELLRDFRSNRNHLAIVIDEFGNTAGLITIEDVLEEIVGEIEDEFDEKDGESGIYTLADGSQRVAGDAAIGAVNEAFDVAPARRRVRHHRRPGRARARPRAAARRSGRVGGLVFAVMLTRGGAVRWFKVTRAPRERRVRAPPLERAAARRPRGRWGAGRRRRSARCRHSPSSTPRSGRCRCCASRCSPARLGAPRRGGRAARLALRHRLAGRRHLVAVHQHAPLRRPAGVAGGAGGAARSAALSLYLAAAMALFARWRARRGGVDAALFAAPWLLAELARAVLFTGFPWVASGYAHVDSPLAGLRPGSASTASARSPRWSRRCSLRRLAPRVPGSRAGLLLAATLALGAACVGRHRQHSRRPARAERVACCRATCRRTRSSPIAACCRRRWPGRAQLAGARAASW